jgi:exosome complex RNA-binding protein Rrp4
MSGDLELMAKVSRRTRIGRPPLTVERGLMYELENGVIVNIPPNCIVKIIGNVLIAEPV